MTIQNWKTLMRLLLFSLLLVSALAADPAGCVGFIKFPNEYFFFFFFSLLLRLFLRLTRV